MKLTEYPMFWINTFVSPGKKYKLTAVDGILSPLIGGFLFGLIMIILGAVTTGKFDVSRANWFVNLIIMPVALVVGALLLSGLTRIICGLMGGRGNYKSDLAVIGSYLGSLALVGGTFCMIVMYIMGLMVLSFAQNGSFTIMFAGIGLFAGACGFTLLTVLGSMLNGLAEIERTSVPKTALALGLGIFAILVIALAIIGAYEDMTVPATIKTYLKLIFQLSMSGSSTTGLYGGL